MTPFSRVGIVVGALAVLAGVTALLVRPGTAQVALVVPLMLGPVAMLLGVAAFVTREGVRAAAVSFALGVAALGLGFLAVLVGIGRG